MKNKENFAKPSARILSYFYAVLILLSLFSVATYTWFSISRTPEVSDMALYINTPSGLEISQDPLAEEWTSGLDFQDLVGPHKPLRPVTWSNNEKHFYAATYGLDGRLTNAWDPLNDDRHANKDNSDGYYIKGTLFARCDQKVTVSLSPAVEIEEGLQGSGTFVIGEPIWDPDAIIHRNGGNGAELSIRIGFLIQKTDVDGQPLNDDTVFYIYEPNSDAHIDGSSGYVDTYSIDLTDSLVPKDRIIGQTTSSWQEADPVERNVVVRTLGEFTTETELFSLTPKELAKITIYVWLEGQDVDCTNVIGHEAKILASIQFAAESDGQSGLIPIE